MEREEIDKLQAELSEYKRGRDNSNEKVLSILTAGKSLTNKHVNYFITDDVSIETLPYIPRNVREEFINDMESIEDEGIKSLGDVENVYAKFMANICVDESLKDPDVWIEFNNVSGKLVSLGSFIWKDLTISEKDMTNFRRK